MTATTTATFSPEIEETVQQIQEAVTAGKNDPFEHALFVADGFERMLERYFPELATAESLDPQATVDRLLELYDAVHGNTGNAKPE